jgi:DNA-directed RNA polymerase subunit RPC12/RpoP
MSYKYNYKVVRQGNITINDEVLNEIQCPNCKGTGKEIFSVIKNTTIKCSQCECQFKLTLPKR